MNEPTGNKPLLKRLIDRFVMLFCRHKHKRIMNFSDYAPYPVKNDKYILTLCEDCKKILHGNWMR